MNPEYEQWWLHKDCPAGTKKAPEAANTLFMAGDGKLKDMSKPAPWSIGEVIVTISPSDALTEFKRVEAEPVVYVGHPTTVERVRGHPLWRSTKGSSGGQLKNSGVIADAARGLPAEVNSEHQLNLKSGAAFADGATKPWKESELDPKFFKRVEAEPVVYVGHPTTVDVSTEQTVEVLKRSSGDKVDWRIPLADTFRHCRGLYRIPWDYSRNTTTPTAGQIGRKPQSTGHISQRGQAEHSRAQESRKSTGDRTGRAQPAQRGTARTDQHQHRRATPTAQAEHSKGTASTAEHTVRALESTGAGTALLHIQSYYQAQH
eukprot:gene4440-14590_t